MLYVANPAAVYFVRMYLMNFKLNEITEAARIDGAGEFRIFNKIILPTLTPVLALQLTFSFVASWNDGYRQTLLLMDWSKKTAPSYIEQDMEQELILSSMPLHLQYLLSQ